MPRISLSTLALLSSLVFALGGALLSSRTAVAQSPPDSLRTEALKDFHGPDLEGKDGPLATAGLDLLVLYHEYRAFRARSEKAFSPSVARANVRNGRVLIDAIADVEGERLRADLQALGLVDAAVAGRVVSGRLPILQVPALAQVESLRGVILSRAQTQGNAPRTSAPAVSPEPAPGLSGSAVGASSYTAAPPKPPAGTGGTIGFFLGGLVVLLLAEL